MKHPPGRVRWLLVLALLAAFAGLAIGAFWNHSATFDETSHLPAGYSALRWHDYRLNPEHPPLIKLWAALPLLPLSIEPAAIDFIDADRRRDPRHSDLLQLKIAWALAPADVSWQWEFGHYFLYGRDDAAVATARTANPDTALSTLPWNQDDFINNADTLLRRGRLMIVPLGVLLALLVFAWSVELFGWPGGLLGMALVCFDPNILAHAGLITTDLGISAFLFGSVYFFWRTCRRLTTWNVVGLLLFIMASAGTKFSAVLLVPILAALALVQVLRPEPWSIGRKNQRGLTTRTARALASGGLLIGSGLAAYVGLWALYGFRYSAVKNPLRAVEAANRITGGDPVSGWLPLHEYVGTTAATRQHARAWPEGIPDDLLARSKETAPLNHMDRALLFAARYRLVPEAYLTGFAFARMKSFYRQAYLGGDISARGFRSYFPVAFALKTPLITLLVLGVAVWLWACQLRRRWLLLVFLGVPLLVFGLLLIKSHLNIGHRHLLPVYPFLYVLCGIVGERWNALRGRWRPALAVGALAGLALAPWVVWAPPWRPARVYPHCLAYFNELAGGPRHGHRWLVDSNLDWGQDLPALKAWLDERGITEPINLAYFGTAAPGYYGIRFLNLPSGYIFTDEIHWSDARVPGYLAMSATNLKGVYFTPETRQTWERWLTHATLIDTVGYSIFIYRLEASPPPIPVPGHPGVQ